MADLILVNANVITMNPASPKGELVAIKNGKIQTVARNDRLKELKNSKTKVIDCDRKTLLPGFIDAHCHLSAFAHGFLTLDLSQRKNIHSIRDIQARIRKLSQKLRPGGWIRGHGYHEFDLAEKRHPTRWDLDEASTAHPVKLTHRSGHAHVLNSLALSLVGISKESGDPPGGMIDRHLETGEPTGLLFEMDAFLSERIPPLNAQELERGVKSGNRELLALGITSIQDASSVNDIGRWSLFRSWKEHHLLEPRVTMMLGVGRLNRKGRREFTTGLDENQLRVGAVKIILDESTGRLFPSQSQLNEMVLEIHQSRLQVAVHAIEERAVESACSAIEYAIKRFPRPDHRHRIEHCSVCPPNLSKRLAALRVKVVTQPSFVFYNGDRYLKTVPRGKLKHLYPIGTLTKNGIEVAGSSDCPTVPPNPLIGIYAAISRKCEAGEAVAAKEGVTPMEALRMYTDYAARASFEEGIKGSITPGKLADLVVLNGDPTRLPSDEIKDLEVEMTILDGEVVWDKTS